MAEAKDIVKNSSFKKAMKFGKKGSSSLLEKKEKSIMEILRSYLDVDHVVEYMKDRLYLVTVTRFNIKVKDTSRVCFFNTDSDLTYYPFYNDFGPLNLACLYKYCTKVNGLFENPANKQKIVVHYTMQDLKKRANAAFLIASYAVLYLNKTPKDAWKVLMDGRNAPMIKPFQDASLDEAPFTIYLLDCLKAIQKAAIFKLFNFNDFNLAEYEKYEKLQHGNLNWIVPNKFIAFLGPSIDNPPEDYVDYFVRNNVEAVIRLNKTSYDPSCFEKAGITTYDLFMPDGTSPTRKILHDFMQIAETTKGAIAVHCKAGLGRTGTMIGVYLIKHYKMKAREAIAWMRICRPGCVIGHQQAWLETMEDTFWREGDAYRRKVRGNVEMFPFHEIGLYSNQTQTEKSESPEDNQTKPFEWFKFKDTVPNNAVEWEEPKGEKPKRTSKIFEMIAKCKFESTKKQIQSQ